MKQLLKTLKKFFAKKWFAQAASGPKKSAAPRTRTVTRGSRTGVAKTKKTTPVKAKPKKASAPARKPRAKALDRSGR